MAGQGKGVGGGCPKVAREREREREGGGNAKLVEFFLFNLVTIFTMYCLLVGS